MDTLLHDVRYALRTLARSRGFAIAALLTLALGIGANSAIFSVVNGVLLRPLPFREPERLMVLWNHNPPQQIEKDVTSAPTFLDWKERSTVFAGMAAYSTTFRNLTGSAEPERLPVGLVTEGFFSLLGLEPAIGRAFTAEEHQQGREPVVMLGHGLWARRFGSDPAIVGRSISLSGKPYTVVGVMPPGVDFPEGAALWLPLRFTAADSRGALWLTVVGRLEEGVTRARAQREMDGVARQLAVEYPQVMRGSGVLLETLSDALVGRVRPALLVLLGAVGFVLLIACANVANLLFARSAARQKELAIRAALGAGRGRMVRQLLTESLVLALLGGGAGLLLAAWGVQLLRALAPPDLPRLDQVGVDGRVLLFTLATAVLTGVLFGLLPAVGTPRPEVATALREGGRGATGGRRSGRLRTALLVAEVALALVLLAGAGLMIRTIAELRGVRTGFVNGQVLTMRISLPGSTYEENARVVDFFDRLLRAVEPLPGVRSAAATSNVLLGRLPTSAAIVVEGRELGQAEARLPVPYDAVTPGYFATMGIGMVEGRGFTGSDDARAPRVVLVNRALARRFFPGQSPVGRRISFGQPRADSEWLRVVGVVEDVRRSGLDTGARPEVYFPHTQAPMRSMVLVVRTASDPVALLSAIRRTVHALDPDQPLADVKTLEQALGETVATRRFSTVLLSLFAAIAALLAAVGIYGVMAYGVTRRTREIGVRLALGAQPHDVLSLVIRQAVRQVLPGLVLGVGAALALTRSLRALLYKVSPSDPLTLGGVTLLLGAVAVLAALLPARRAACVDPVVALRSE